jgi:hypothetical protein
MLQCQAIADIAQRVACYDAAASAIDTPTTNDARGPAANPPPKAAVSPAETEQRERAQFGRSLRDQQQAAARNQEPPPPERLAAVTGEVLARRELTPGAWRITLRDGGTWQTITRDDFNPPRVGSSVTIRRGVLGGYLLESGGQPSIRVNRID